MSRLLRSTALVALGLAAAGCYRMTYIRLSPPGAVASAEMRPEEMEDQVGWRTFLVFGWVGVGDEVDAAARCGGVEHVQWINTRRTLFQGLASLVTANLYSPWAGRVTCDHR